MSLLNTEDCLNFKHEFSLLTGYIKEIWSLPEPSEFHHAAREAFNQGLHDGRFWFDKDLSFRLASTLNNSDEIISPISARNEMSYQGDSSASLYDGLCNIDSYLNDILTIIHSSQTRFGKWDFSKNADALSDRLRTTYALNGASPKPLSADEQSAAIKAYEGYVYAGAGSLPVTEMISYRQAKYSNDEQGLDYVRSLIAAIYSHGLSCAQEQNDRATLSKLTPAYRHYRDTELNFDNGQQILTEMADTEVLQIGLLIKAPTLYSSKDFEQSLAKKLAFQDKISKETPEEALARKKEQRKQATDTIKEIVEQMDTPEYLEREEKEHLRVDNIISEFRNSAPIYSI